MTERMLSLEQATEMGFLRSVHDVTLCNEVRSCNIRIALNVEPLLRIERSQIFGSVTCPKWPHKGLERQVQLAKPTGKRPRGLPRQRWSDYISDLSCSRLGVETAQPSEIVVDPEVFQVFLGLLPPRPFREEKRGWKWMKWITFTLFSLFTGA